MICVRIIAHAFCKDQFRIIYSKLLEQTFIITHSIVIKKIINKLVKLNLYEPSM